MARATWPGEATSAIGLEIEASRELGGRLGIREGLRTGLRDDDEIRRRPDVGLPKTEDFADEALYAVPDDGVPDPFADRDAEPRA